MKVPISTAIAVLQTLRAYMWELGLDEPEVTVDYSFDKSPVRDEDRFNSYLKERGYL